MVTYICDILPYVICDSTQRNITNGKLPMQQNLIWIFAQKGVPFPNRDYPRLRMDK